MANLREQYPSMAYLLDEPEVGPILEQADREGWPPEKLQSRLEATTWWRTHSSSIRDYHDLLNTDPASFWQAVQEKGDVITDMAARAGFIFSQDEIQNMAKAALYLGRSDADILRAMATNAQARVTPASGYQARVKQLAAAYLVPVSNDLISDWTRKLASGQYTEDNLTAQLADWAKQMYPHLSQQIDSGEFQNFTSVMKNQIASTLEIAPGQIDMVNDPRWRQTIDTLDDKGNHRAMTLYEVQQYARQQPEYRYTRGARDQVAQLGDTIAKQMGAVA
jgi:hypothetical protein